MDRAKQIELLEALLAQKAKRGLDDLLFFNKNIVETDPSRRAKLVPHVHGDWNTWYHNSKKRIKMILVPRGTFKSTFFTVGLTLQKIAKNRDERILIANATGSNSERFLGEIKEHLRGNETYLELYGKMYDKRMKWNENEIVVPGRSLGVKESTVTAIGVGGNLVSQHYSTVICDDLVNNENSLTKLQADKVIEWWKRSFSLLDRDGDMIIIGTRWSYYELYSYILKNLTNEVDYYIRGAYNKDGSLYFPEELSTDKLKELKKLHGSYAFSAFYLNNPVDSDSSIIKHSDLKYFTYDRSLKGRMNIFSMVDPAVSQAAKADYSVIITVGVTANNDWFILDIRREKFTVGELINEMFDVHSTWKPINMSIEVIGLAQGLTDSIHNEEDHRGVYLPLIEIKTRNNMNKQQRIRSILQPRFERKKVFIREDLEHRDIFEEELLTFPKAAHDDIIDPLTDLEDIGFAPDMKDLGGAEPESPMELRLQKKVQALQNPVSDVYDLTMGEYW